MALRPVVQELPGVAFAAFPGGVGYPPRDLVNLQVVTIEDFPALGFLERFELRCNSMHPAIYRRCRQLYA